MVTGYESAHLSQIYNTEAAWKAFVGSSSPTEFLMYSAEDDVRDAVAAYVEELSGAMGHDYSGEEIEAITGMLVAYIRERETLDGAAAR